MINCEVQLFDMQGNLIIRNEYEGGIAMNKGTLDASKLNTGTYILKLQCNGAVEESLFMKR